MQFFFQHELLRPYRYYWRVEPDVKFFCDVPYDPFLYMEDNDKVYGFTISLIEWEATIPSLWSTVKEFIAEHPEYVAKDNSMGADGTLADWSNFEIADMDFWRGEAYQAFFNYLESKGGFYYERWGDAPVHSIAASLFANKSQDIDTIPSSIVHKEMTGLEVAAPVTQVIVSKLVTDS
ncbi:hypothetical protein DXG01_015903 [Tephrocybe rancida]|nr:hypothetical protein DXG01_015903 [Tephrocybe rancida]